MKVCVIGAGYVGLVTGTGSRRRATTWPAPTSTRAKIASLREGRVADLRARPRADASSATSSMGTLTFTTDVTGRHRRAPTSSSSPSARRSARTAPPTSWRSTPWPRPSPSTAKRECVLVLKSTVPVGTNARVRRIVEGVGESRIHVVSQPRVPQRGRRGQRLHAARPHRRRLRRGRRLRARPDAPPVPPALAQPRHDRVDGAGERRAHQVRRQHHARDAHLVHERDRGAVREGRRRRQRRAPRRRSRQPHRRQVPVRRPGLRRLVLSQGRPGAGPRRARAQRRRSSSRPPPTTSTSARRACCCASSSSTSTATCAARTSRSGASPSSRAPTTSASRRRSRLIDSLLAEGATVAAHDPEAREQARATLRRHASSSSTTNTTRCNGADALVLVTEWRQYQNPDFERIKTAAAHAGPARRPEHLEHLRPAQAGLLVRGHRCKGLRGRGALRLNSARLAKHLERSRCAEALAQLAPVAHE